MDEFLASSDLCEENGLSQAAEVLRRVSASGGKAFVVVERGWEYNDEIDQPEPSGQPRSIFLDREEAERVASERNIRVLRENNILSFCYRLEHVTNHSAAELSAKMSAILGRANSVPGDPEFFEWDDQDYGRPTIPAEATDDQARAISDLFTLKFAYVVETEFA